MSWLSGACVWAHANKRKSVGEGGGRLCAHPAYKYSRWRQSPKVKARKNAAVLKDLELAQALSASSDWCRRHSKEAAAKAQLEEESAALAL